MNTFKVICVDNENRPKEIPLNIWLKKDQEYHVTHIYYHYQQKKQGFELSEIFLDDNCFPFVSFDSSRFRVPQEEIKKLFQMLKECTNLDDIDIRELIEETQTEKIIS